MESNHAAFRTAIVKMAVQSFGCNVAGAYCDSNIKTVWWAAKAKDAIRLKKESYKAWLACWTPRDSWQLSAKTCSFADHLS